MLRAWRFLWITTTVLISLLLLLILSSLLIISQLDLNRFKDSIETQVTELTGRQLKLDGDLHIDFSLQPLISIEKASYANAAWGKESQMLSFERLQLQIDLLPLLDSKLVVEQLLLEGVELTVETSAEGMNNWQLEKLQSKEPEIPDLQEDTEPFHLPVLPIIRSLHLKSIHAYYHDASADIETDAVIDELKLSNQNLDSPVKISADGTINQQPFKLSGETGFLTSVTTENMTEQGISLQLDADISGVRLKADGKIEHPVTGKGINIAFSVIADDLEKSFTAVTGGSIYRYINKSEQSLALNFSARLNDSNDSYDLSTIRFRLADNNIDGSLSFINRPDRPGIIANLHSEKINLNQFLVTAAKPAKKSSLTNEHKKNSAQKIELPDTALPFDLLKSVDAEIKYSIEQLWFDTIRPRAIRFNASLDDGLLQVKQLDLALDGAPIRSRLTIDSRTNSPQIKTTLDVDALPLRPIMQYIEIEQLKDGTLSSNVELKTHGKSARSLVMNLAGNADIQLHEVRLEDRIEDKPHTAYIKQLNLAFTGTGNPLGYEANGDVDGSPLALSGALDSPAAIIKNKNLTLALALSALKFELDVDGSIARPHDADSAQLDITLDIPSTSASMLQIAHLLPKIKPANNLPDLPVTLRGKLTVATNSYRFDEIQLNAADNDLSGYISADLQRSKPFIDAKLTSKLIDLNQLVPATKQTEDDTDKSTEQEIKPDSQKTRLFPDKPLPALDALDNIDIKLIYTLNKLVSNEQVIDNVSLDLVLKDSILRLDPLIIDFSSGTIKTELSLNAINEPQLQLDTHITKLDYGQLMTILGIKKYAHGEMDAEIKLNATGQSVSALMASLDGKVRVTTVDGVLDSSSLKLLSKDLMSAMPFTDDSDRQKINCGVVQFDITHGLAATHSMVINTGSVSALGTGDIDLASEELSLYIAPRTKRTSVLELAMVPVNITGPLISPSIVPDLAGSTVSTTKTAANIGLVIATSGLWLAAEGLTDQLWEKFVDDTDYCAKALAGEAIAPTRIKLNPAKGDTSVGEDTDDTEDWDDDY